MGVEQPPIRPTRVSPRTHSERSSSAFSMWYALRPCIFARFTSSRVFAEFFPPTTMIVFTCSASSLAAC